MSSKAKSKKYTIAIAGTTHRTVILAQTLLADKNFEIPVVITPKAKPVGRKQIMTPNPLQIFAEKNKIDIVFIKKKIDDEIKQQILAQSQPDFLLVVDFGYFVPSWLLKLPRVMPLNIHPSALPRWRGSSPGQFVILNGEKLSAVTMIQMTDKFDQGPIIFQKPFQVLPEWTQTEYYQYSFKLAAANLVPVLSQLAQGKLRPRPQPLTSPTPTARRLTKQDAFREWKQIKRGITESKEDAFKIERASKAFSPWPLLWTKIETKKGQKRMQILQAHLNADGLLMIDTVKIEGMSAKPWSEVKDRLLPTVLFF